MKIFKFLLKHIILLFIIIVSSLIFIAYNNYQTKIKDLPFKDAITNIESKSNYTSINDIPEYHIHAVISIEDKRFYTHKGIDLISISRAFLEGLSKSNFEAGGSSITQQLAKNIYLNFDKNIIRKLTEVFMANMIENTINKDKILELYLNIIYYGDGYYGIYDASMGYFNKEPKDLNIAEATLLAGLPQSPSNYQLSNGYDLALKRHKQVLDSMLNNEYIDENTYNDILNYQFN